MLAEHYAHCGYLQQGFDLLCSMNQDGAQNCMAAELPRLEAELLARFEKPDLPKAVDRAREAIAIARRQESRSFELRAATTLARLLVKQGRREEARDALAGIYGWFTEGFDTADLKSARALLDELGAG